MSNPALPQQRDLWNELDRNAPLEELKTAVPGPNSLEYARLLADFEAREVTYLSPVFPVFWDSAAGAIVTDADGNRFLDLSSAFGVAALGHNHPKVVEAVAAQAGRLLHGMGDVHPTSVRAQLLARLAVLTPGALRHGYLGLNGGDAVEFARKTALLTTGKPGSIHYSGAYHGLSYGTLEIAGLPRFREPFAAQLAAVSTELPYPAAGTTTLAEAVAQVETALAADPRIGMIIIEPIAGRAGTLVPVPGYLPALRRLAQAHGAVLVFDEIYTGFGRTGSWFACEDEGAIPDILCLGKALGGGMPLSAAIGTVDVMNAWPASRGEALHTATFLGSPPACAAALAVLRELERLALPQRAHELGERLGHTLRSLGARIAAKSQLKPQVRGRGFMWALDLGDAEIAIRAVTQALAMGLIVLPQGASGSAIAITPPLTIAHRQLDRALSLLESAIFRALAP